MNESEKNNEVDEIFKELAISIREYRLGKAMTQSDLAIKAGVTQQQLSKLELGINCNLNTFIKVAIALGVDVNIFKKGDIK